MLETSFLNVTRGNRLSAFMGLQTEGSQGFTYAPDYTYVEIPILGFWHPSEEKLTEKVMRNQYVRIYPACRLDVKGAFKVEVEGNPELGEFGMYQPSYYLQPGSGPTIPGIWFNPRKDLAASELKYAVRLYLRA